MGMIYLFGFIVKCFIESDFSYSFLCFCLLGAVGIEHKEDQNFEKAEIISYFSAQ